MNLPGPDDIWARVRAATPARIGLGRSGVSLPTNAALAFALDHARARDAVHAPFDVETVARTIEALGLPTLRAASAAADRETYLRRPDLGRRLDLESQGRLQRARHQEIDLAIVVADGLSSAAAQNHAAPLIETLLPHLAARGRRLGPVVLASQARVALGDEIGFCLGARLVAVMLGERPGLSSPDSLGIYLTLGPRPGRTDAERNCISNVRPAGLSYAAAAFKLDWLVNEALTLGLTGVELKDESDLVRLPIRRDPPAFAIQPIA